MAFSQVVTSPSLHFAKISLQFPKLQGETGSMGAASTTIAPKRSNKAFSTGCHGDLGDVRRERGNPQRLQGAGRDMRARGGVVDKHHMHVAAEQVTSP
jgi:hypothetical protein